MKHILLQLPTPKPITLKDKHVCSVVSRWTGIPCEDIDADELERLQNLESILEKEVLGQKEAIKSLCCAIRRCRTGLKDDRRPMGSFIFLGTKPARKIPRQGNVSQRRRSYKN